MLHSRAASFESTRVSVPHRYALSVTTYLDDILVAHRRRASKDERRRDDLLDAVGNLAPTRAFAEALRGDSLRVIAEIKRKSPSKGALSIDLDPQVVAQEYASGGASAISVLTDEPHFSDSESDLKAARDAVDLPILRKDFTVDERDVLDARLMGADAVLLIAAALSDLEIRSFLALAHEVGLDALVEVHDGVELDRALAAGARVVGVNQRDLRTFEVDMDRCVSLASLIPSEIVAVAESGVRDAKDAERLAAAGYNAVLVGESVVTASRRSAAVSALAGHGVAANREVVR